jgi:hypothetical protein
VRKRKKIMIKEVEILKMYLKNSYKYFAFPYMWIKERSE